jgi:glycosyltransferase involved in cell wall biosynthesis
MVVYTDYVFDARVRREAETLAASGFHVRCLCLRTKGSEGPRFVLSGVHVQELAISKYRGKSQLSYALSYFRFLALSSITCVALLLRRELDVVHVHNLPDFLVFAGLLPRLLGRLVVLDVHDSVPETFATKFSGSSTLWRVLCAEERLSARVAHKVICVNDLQRDTLVARGIPAAKTFVSMNVPDHRIFGRAPARDTALGRQSHFNLVYHGTMAERLGVDLIIRAVAQLGDRIPCARLHLWGHGDDLPEFQRLARTLGIESQVLFQPKGFPLHELPTHLSAMDIGVVGNRRSVATELMMPVKLLEYISQGIPAVVPRLKAITHYFTDDQVAYFEPGDVDSLADAIYRLYSDPRRRARQAAQARTFLAEHGWERQGNELVGFYQSLWER